MVGQRVIEKLESEVDRIRTRYDPKSTEDLVKSAKNEYGVREVVNTPLVCNASRVSRVGKDLYIFYHATFKPRERHALGHEIGHIAAGHLDGRPESWEQESEANYFSQRLNGISPSKYWTYLAVGAVLSFREDVLNPFRRTKEIERLKRLGVYHVLERA